MRRTIITAVILALSMVMIATAAKAQVVTDDGLGRNVRVINHFGNPIFGRAICSAQGQFVDTNGNAIPDSIRGRGACLESPNGVARFRITSVYLQVFFAGTWKTVAVRTLDAVSTTQPSYVVSFTPTQVFCAPPNNIGLTYRVVNNAVIRWTDNTLSNRTTVSHSFEAPAARGSQLC